MSDPGPNSPTSPLSPDRTGHASAEPALSPAAAEAALTSFLETLRSAGGLELDSTITQSETPGRSSVLEVQLSGPDTPRLLDRQGELLHALESVGAAILRLSPEQADQLSFDAAGFKAERAAAIMHAAEDAISRVRSTGRPHPFPPMNSRERRLLHLALVPSGLATASSGLGPRRFVVLYPEGQTSEPESTQPPRPSFSRPGSFRSGPRSGFPDRRSGQGSGRAGRSSPQQAPVDRPQPNPQELPLSLRQAAPAAAQDSDLSDSDDQGNRLDSAPTTPESAAAVEARLESIRRAFRKR